MPKNNYSILLMAVTLLCGTSAHAEIYKWVDDNGMTHYGDSAPQTRQSQTLDFGELRRPAAPKSQVRQTGLSFPEQPRRVRRQSNAAPQHRVMRRPVAAKQASVKSQSTGTQQTSRHETYALPVEQPQQQFREFQLVDKSEQIQAALPEAKPDLDAEEYDWRDQSKNTGKKSILNVRKKLCGEKRMLLATLQETGFKAYTDEEGHYRLAWGGDDIYQGKRHFLTDKQVATKTKQAMFEVEQYCVTPNDKALQETARANWIRAEYCTVSKAVLEDLEHPFMRSTEAHIKQQTKEVKRFCAQLAPGRYRHDHRYYPIALRSDVVLPRHLTLKEEETSEVIVKTPEDTLDQLLALIQ